MRTSDVQETLEQALAKAWLDRMRVRHRPRRCHRSMKNVVLLRNYFRLWVLEREIADFVYYYSTERYHEALDDITPADVYLSRASSLEPP